jgi:type II secretory pathway component PulK
MKKLLLRQNKGMALMIVISSIAILTILMYALKFETALNQIRSINGQEQYQARLNAESGLTLSLTRLEVYKEALNQLNQNPDLKKMAPLEMINQIWSMPLIFPIPSSLASNILIKSMLDKIGEGLLIQGEIQTSIQSLGSKLNINIIAKNNLLTIKTLSAPKVLQTSNEGTQNPDKDKEKEETDKKKPEDSGEPKTLAQEYEEKLEELIKNAIKEKALSDQQFDKKYSSKDTEYLINAIKFYGSDSTSDIGQARNQMEPLFSKNNIQAKNAPLHDISELYLLPEWDDELVDLIKNEVTTYPVTILDINKVTAGFLKLLLPDVSTEMINEFFKQKNASKNPVSFNTKEEFIKYLSTQVKVAPENIAEKMKSLEQQGYFFSAAPQIFEVVSTGKYNNAEVTLKAIVLLSPTPEKSDTPTESGAKLDENGNPVPTPPSSSEQGGDEEKQKTQEKKTAPLVGPLILDIMQK